MKILGIDQALRSTGAVLIDYKNKTIDLFLIENHIGTTMPSSHIDSYTKLSIENLLYRTKPKAVIFEQYGYSRQTNNITRIAEVIGYTQHVMETIKTKVFTTFTTQQAARSVISINVKVPGKSEDKKELVSKSVLDHINIGIYKDFTISNRDLLQSYDVTDAFALAHCGGIFYQQIEGKHH